MKIAFVNRRSNQPAPHTGPTTYAQVLGEAARSGGAQVDWLGGFPQSGQYDVIHVLDMKQFVLSGNRNQVRKCPYPVVLDMHDDYWTGRNAFPGVDSRLRSYRRAKMAPGYIELLNSAAHVIVHSPTAVSAVPHDRVTSIPLPMRAVASVGWSGNPESLNILFVGRDGLRKGLPVLAEALRLLRDRNQPCTLHVVGAEFPHLRLMQRWWLRGLEAERHGAMIPGNMDRLWEQAHVVVLPSYDETFGLVPLEALLRGVPVVVTDVGGLGPWVRACGGGIVVPPGSPGELSKALEDMQSRYSWWREKALVARESLISLHDPELVWSQVEEVYRQAQ